jgi:hypothetical protein
MLVKTPEFDRQFRQDITQIYINRYSPYQLVGSYSIKPYGDIITDIDFNAYVYFTPKVFEIIANIAKRVNSQNKFFFIRLNSGTQVEYKVPWSFSNDGDCTFNYDNAVDWYNNLKKLLLKEEQNYIERRLLKEHISIKDLIEIENFANSKGKISWYLEDLEKGTKTINGLQYSILDIIKKESGVLKYCYMYGNDFVSLDVRLYDKKYKYQGNRYHDYYLYDCYKIMKSYRWKLDEKYLENYLKIMKAVSKIVSLKSIIELYGRVLPANPVLANRIKDNIDRTLKEMGHKWSSNIVESIDKKVDTYMCQYIQSYYNKLDRKTRLEYFLYGKRAEEASKPLSVEEIRSRKSILCPFFNINAKDYHRMIKLAKRAMLDVDKLDKCFNQVCKEYGIQFKDLVDLFDINNYAIESEGGDVVLKERDHIIQKIPRKKLSDLQTYVLITKMKN